MLNADNLQLLTLMLAAGSLLVSLIVLSVLLRRTSGSIALGKSAGNLPSAVQSTSMATADDHQLVAVLTAAIAAAQADETSDRPLAAAIAAAVTANRAANGSTAGFVIRKIRRV